MAESGVICDIDGVLANFDAAFCAAATEVLGRDIIGPAQTWSLTDAYGLTDSEFESVWRSSELIEQVRKAKPYRMSHAVARSLPRGSVYLTARGSDLSQPNAYEMRQATVAWLWENGFPNFPVEFSDKKAAYAAFHGIKTAIEDCPHHITELAKLGVTCLVPHMPYNDHVKHDNVIRLGMPDGWE